MPLKIYTLYSLPLSLVIVLAFVGCTTHENLPSQATLKSEPELTALPIPQKIGNWAKFVELPNPAEKQTTWYLNYDTRLSHIKNASTRKGLLLIQPYDQTAQNVENTSSTIEITINCYGRYYSFGIIQVYAQAYAQGQSIEKSNADKQKNFASPYNPINTGIINFYCKDQ